MTISLAVIGAGRIGQIHATNAARNPGVTLAGVADAIAEPAAKLAAALGTNPAVQRRLRPGGTGPARRALG